jgi:signal transduction histidine kinase
MSTTARRWAADAALAALVTGVELAASLAAPQWHGAKESKPGTFGIILLVAGGLALLARRRYPGAVLAVVLAATLGANALNARLAWLALIVAFFTAVHRGRRVAAIASLFVGYGASVWHDPSAEFALLLAAGLVTLLSVAEASRAWNARAAADRRGREEATARRATEQRLAIARDLHDVVAHSISVINVQSNTALHLMDRQPERARDALTAIREVSGQALTELGSVLGALRDPDGSSGVAPLAPAPGVARLDELAARARSAGFTVSVSAQGPVRPLSAGVDAAAYRIVQEALTNAVRHSGGHAANVLLRYSDSDLVIEVADDGAGSAAPKPGVTKSAATGPGAGGSPAAGPAGSGNGLAGMTERARALGGTVDAGPRPGGGFQVLARLPT